MKKITIAFPSVTIASKAKYILETSGYEAKMIRTPASLASGCGYSVTVSGTSAAVTGLLQKHGVRYKAISESNG